MCSRGRKLSLLEALGSSRHHRKKQPGSFIQAVCTCKYFFLYKRSLFPVPEAHPLCPLLLVSLSRSGVITVCIWANNDLGARRRE